MPFLTQPHAIYYLAAAAVLFFAILGAVAGWHLHRVKQDDRVAALTEVIHGELKRLEVALQEKTSECEVAVRAAADEQRRRVEVVEMIAVVERDREGWKKRYWECGLGHSVAQDMLMRQILILRGILRKNHLKIPRDSENCDQTVNDFKAAHLGQNGPENPCRIVDGVGVASGHSDSVESAPKC